MNLEKILTLVGRSNNGKTTVLKDLIRKILAKKDIYSVIDKYYATNYQYIRFLDGLDVQKDVTCCIKQNNTNKIFAIITYGDEKAILQRQFNKAVKNNCQFVVCASHETNTMYEFLKENAESVERFYKFKEIGDREQIDNFNKNTVNQLYDRLEEILKGMK